MGAQIQDQLVVAAQKALLEANLIAGGKADPRGFMLDVFSEIVEMYGWEAAYAARDYALMDFAERGETVRAPEVDLAAPVLEQVDSSGRWAIYGTEDDFGGAALDRLQGSLTRLVLQPYRDTILDTVRDVGKRTRTAVARVPDVGACAFCRMLASRGAVYGSAEKAQSTKDGKRFHDHCRCSTQIARVDGADLPASVKALEIEWSRFAGETDELSLRSYEKWLKEGRAK